MQSQEELQSRVFFFFACGVDDKIKGVKSRERSDPFPPIVPTSSNTSAALRGTSHVMRSTARRTAAVFGRELHCYLRVLPYVVDFAFRVYLWPKKAAVCVLCVCVSVVCCATAFCLPRSCPTNRFLCQLLHRKETFVCLVVECSLHQGLEVRREPSA